jgi:thiopeptide-type bacteriocin biosynthesis protein
VQLDTYEREVERYGGPVGMDLAERLFHADSEAALELLELIEPGDEGLAERWKLTLCGIDSLLDSLEFDLPARKTLMAKVRGDFAGEFNIDKQLIAQMGTRFRVEREELEALLAKQRAPESSLFAGLEVLRCRSEKLGEISTELRGHTHRRKLSQTLEDLAASYINMHANRLLRSAQRAQELVIYDYLLRLYHSKLAQLSPPARDNQPAPVDVARLNANAW